MAASLNFFAAPTSPAALDALRRSLARLGAQPDLPALYAAAVDEAAAYFGATQCCLSLYDERTGARRIVRPALGLDDRQVAALQGAIAHAGGDLLLALPEPGVMRLFDPQYASLVDQGVKTLLGERDVLLAALVAEGRGLGSLRVANKADGSLFSDHEVHLLGLFASQLSVLIQGRQTLAKEQRARRLAESLLQVPQVVLRPAGGEGQPGPLTVPRENELNETLAGLLQLLGQVVDYGAAGVSVFDGRHLRLIAASGASRFTSLVGVTWDALTENGALEAILASGSGMRLDDAATDTRWPNTPNLPRPHAWIGAPIWSPGKRLAGAESLIGLLTLSNDQPGSFAADDVEVAQAFADQIAILLENQRLYAEMQRYAQDEQKRARQLAAAYEEVKAVDRMKDEFVQTVSHELRTPLTFIKGYVELMLEGMLGDLNQEQLEALRIVDQRTANIVHLVNDIISLTRTEDLELLRQTVDLAEIAEGALASAQAVTGQAGIRLERDLPLDLPLVSGDPQRLSQVFDNLIGNAIKFSPRGGTICVRLRTVDSVVRAEVCDQGIGIPADRLPRVWDRFYQVDSTTTRRFGGTGLGLAIVKRLVEAHGGHVGVESTEGEGSIFFFTIPIAA